MTTLLISGHLRNDSTSYCYIESNFNHVFKVLYDKRDLTFRKPVEEFESDKVKITNFDEMTARCKTKMLELNVMDRILKKINPYPHTELPPNITYQILENRNRLLEMTRKVNIDKSELTILTRPDVEVDFQTLINWPQVEKNTLYVSKKSAHCEFNIYHLEDIVMWGEYETIEKLLEFPDYYEQILEALDQDKLEGIHFCCPHTILGFYSEIIRGIKTKKCDLSYEFGRCAK
jgi:hypothetical protein